MAALQKLGEEMLSPPESRCGAPALPEIPSDALGGTEINQLRSAAAGRAVRRQADARQDLESIRARLAALCSVTRKTR